MANEVFTKTKCDRQGCNEVVERPGALDTLPQGWCSADMTIDGGPPIRKVYGPKCLAIINPPPKKPRADKGTHRKPDKFEPLVGQKEAPGPKKAESTTKGKNTNYKASSENQDQDCVLCPIRAECKIVGIAERYACWTAKLVSGEIKEG